MKRFALFLVFTLIFSGKNSFAQHLEANIWYFGKNAGLDFNSGTPVALTGSQLNTLEGCLTISDKNTGQLLFYSDGIKVWNRNHTQMPNGNGLWGHPSSTQSGVVVPKPGSTTEYYIFTVPAQAGYVNGISMGAYSIVDMTLDGGLGDVTLKNQPLLSPAVEKITAVRHCNGRDVWVIMHKWNSNQFYAFLVSPTGVAAPVISSAGVFYYHGVPPSAINSETIGYLKAAPDQQHIAMACFSTLNVAEVYDFNNVTGVISNPISLTIPPTPAPSMIPPDTSWYGGPYGVSFSPDGSRLYVAWHTWIGLTNYVFQFDLTAGSAAAINASRVSVAFISALNFGALQLASDGKLYLAKLWYSSSSVNAPVGSPTIDRFNFPNALGLGSNWQPSAVTLAPNTFSVWGFPDFIESFFSPPVATNFFDTTICAGATAFFNPAYGIAMDSVSWNFGDPASGPLNYDTALSTSHTYNAEGNYLVSLIVHYNCHHDTVQRTVTVTELPIFGNDTSICGASTYTVDAGNPGSTYLWSTGANTQTIQINSTQTVWVQLTNPPCIARDTITVTFVPNLPVNLGNDTTLCVGDTVMLDAGYPGGTYLWSTGATTQTINVTSNGTYSVTVDDGTCIGWDTVDVNFVSVPQVNLGPDTSICNGQVLTLDAGFAGYQYQWSNSSTAQSINVTTAGTYEVTMTNGYCTVSDSIDVNVITLQPVSLGPDSTVCASVVLNLQSANPQANHIWSTGDTAYSIQASNQGMYWVRDYIGSCEVSDTINITHLPSPTVDLGPDTALCGADQFMLYAAFTNATSFLWDDGSTLSNRLITERGKYWIEAASANGCTTSDTVEVNGFGCEFYIYVPNVFTPNLDRKNPTFFPVGYNIIAGNMQIWDRWGEPIYYTDDFSKGWDGTYKGRDCQMGAYVYVIYYSGLAYDGTVDERIKVGTVILLR
jgi:gliding motility-associated-like protein